MKRIDYIEIIDDFGAGGVASVMLAVAVKQLKRQLDENEFNAIMSDLTENQFSEWENMSDEELDELLMELDTKNDRILH